MYVPLSSLFSFLVMVHVSAPYSRIFFTVAWKKLIFSFVWQIGLPDIVESPYYTPGLGISYFDAFCRVIYPGAEIFEVIYLLQWFSVRKKSSGSGSVVGHVLRLVFVYVQTNIIGCIYYQREQVLSFFKVV